MGRTFLVLVIFGALIWRLWIEVERLSQRVSLLEQKIYRDESEAGATSLADRGSLHSQ